jgi:hypothetical protein
MGTQVQILVANLDLMGTMGTTSARFFTSEVVTPFTFRESRESRS